MRDDWQAMAGRAVPRLRELVRRLEAAVIDEDAGRTERIARGLMHTTANLAITIGVFDDELAVWDSARRKGY